MAQRTQTCTEATIQGRLAKAVEFLEAAESQRKVSPQRANAWVTLYIHAGIAAADVICCRALGYHARGEDHVQALSLLRSIQPDGPGLANALGVLLAMKTKAGYGEQTVGADDRVRAPRRASELVSAARRGS